MSARRGKGAGRTRLRPRLDDSYREVAGKLDDRPAFDCTPFDPSMGASAWETIPSGSIFSPPKYSSASTPLSSRSPGASLRNPGSSSARPVASQDWLHSNAHQRLVSYLNNAPELVPISPDEIILRRRGPATSGCRNVLRSNESPNQRPRPSTSSQPFSGSSTPVFDNSSQFSPGPSTGSRLAAISEPSSYSGAPGPSRFAEIEDTECSFNYCGVPGCDDCVFDGADDDSEDEIETLKNTSKSFNQNCSVEASQLPQWKPHYASERLEDPDNPPPMFHPAFNNEWRNDPNISEELRLVYEQSLKKDSEYHNIFDYGKLSEFNTQNLYDPEKFSQNKWSRPAQVGENESFGDPYEALDRPTDDVPDKYRKEKYKYFELKKQLELYTKYGMESELSLYPGLLERMEADPWTGDCSGPEVEVYLRGQEGDPALDDRLLENMEALINPNNESLIAFYEAMKNPPPIRNEEMVGNLSGKCRGQGTKDLSDEAKLEELVAQTNQGRRGFWTAMGNPPPIANERSLHQYPQDDGGALERLEQLVAPTNPQRMEFMATMSTNPPPVAAQERSHSTSEECTALEEMEHLIDPTNEGRRGFEAAMKNLQPRNDSGETNPYQCLNMESSVLNDSFQVCLDPDEFSGSASADHPLNTTFCLSGDDSDGGEE